MLTADEVLKKYGPQPEPEPEPEPTLKDKIPETTDLVQKYCDSILNDRIKREGMVTQYPPFDQKDPWKLTFDDSGVSYTKPPQSCGGGPSEHNFMSRLKVSVDNDMLRDDFLVSLETSLNGKLYSANQRYSRYTFVGRKFEAKEFTEMLLKPLVAQIMEEIMNDTLAKDLLRQISNSPLASSIMPTIIHS